MERSSGIESEKVSTTVELAGSYERIAEILGQTVDKRKEYEQITEDMAAVLEIVEHTGGATKSHIVDELPTRTNAALETESVIHLLRVLELYDFVYLDGNTWRPGDPSP
jgi:hypothetical protein